MRETRQLICISCPVGCRLTVELEDGAVLSVKGHSCKNGKLYAQKECTNPTRVVTSTVPVENGTLAVVPVKTRTDIPKHRIRACIEALRGIKVQAPVEIGDVIVLNVAGTGVDMVATRRVDVVKS